MVDDSVHADLLQLTIDLVKSFDDFWSHNAPSVLDLRPTREVVVTRASRDAKRMTRSGALIRGLPDTNAYLTSAQSSSIEKIEQRIQDVFVARHENIRTFPERRGPYPAQAVRRIAQALDSALKVIPFMDERMAEWIGAKHYEPQDLRHKLDERPDAFRGHGLDMIAWALANAFHSFDYAIPRPSSFYLGGESTEAIQGGMVDVEAVAANVLHHLLEVAARQFNEYDVFIVLNAPLFDAASEILIANVNLAGNAITLCGGYVQDDLLTTLRRYNDHLPIDNVNCFLRFEVAHPVSASVDTYQATYALGSHLAEVVLDALRLIRNGDLGVVALEVLPRQKGMPYIRKVMSDRYDPGWALYLPQRFRFRVDSLTSLSEQEVAELPDLIQRLAMCEHASEIGTALHRFRSSCDRYALEDPERLLDMAFAFEALFLTDVGENKDLGYRLRLRVARFLEREVDDRLHTFEVMKDFYDFRSRIAHGATLDTLKPKERERLESVLADAPVLLRRALRRMIDGEGPPPSSHQPQLIEWWRRLELK